MMKEKEEEEKKSKIRSDNVRFCKKCHSYFGYVRIRDKKFVCRSCGYIDGEDS